MSMQQIQTDANKICTQHFKNNMGTKIMYLMKMSFVK